MKKFLSILLCFTLLCTLLCGCNSLPLNGELLEFESTEDMQQHLQGIWQRNGMTDEYYIIFEDQVDSFSVPAIQSMIEDCFAEVILDENGDFENLNAQTTFNFLDRELNDHSYAQDITFITEESAIILGVGSEFEEKYYITDKGLECINEEGGYTEDSYTKISDKTIIDENLFESLFGTFFETAKANYELPFEKAILSAAKVEEIFKNKHPKINNYILVSDDKETKNRIYTDNGSLDGDIYNEVFMVNDERILYSTKQYNGDEYTYLYQNNKVIIGNDISSKPLVDILSDALIFVSKHPKVLSAEELLKRFEAEAEVKSGTRTFKKNIDGIHYNIVVSIYDGKSNVIISKG